MLAEHALDAHHDGFATLLLGMCDLQSEEQRMGGLERRTGALVA